jgi:hypothetical protein
VTLGAVAAGGRVEPRPTGLAFAATLACLALLPLIDRVPLRAWALYRCGLALALMRGSRR